MRGADKRMWTGGCQCGAVRYELHSPQWVSICHCRMCQRASGQPFMVFAGGEAEKVRWTRGRPSFFHSSDIAERGFCSACGTPLTYGRKSGGTLSVTIGSLDDSGDLQPTLQNGVESKMAWIDGLAEVPMQRTGEWRSRIGVETIVVHQSRDGEGQ